MALDQKEMIKPIVLKALGINLDPTTTDGLIKEHDKIEMYEEILEEAKKELRATMFERAELVGTKDDKGSHTVVLENGTGFKKEIRRPTPKVNADLALDLFRRKGLLHRIDEVWKVKDGQEDRVISILRGSAPDLVEKTDVVSEGEIESAFINGEITDEELKTVVDMGTPTYALKKIKPKVAK